MVARKAKTSSEPEILLYAASERDADAYYFSGVFVPDPFIAFSCGGRKVAVLNQLEYARVRKEGDFDEVVALEEWIPDAVEAYGASAYPAGVIALLAKRMGIASFLIPHDFPAGLAFQLGETGLDISIADGPLFPQRERKSDREARCIQEGNAASAAGFREVERILRRAEIRGNRLYFEGRALTSERLRERIEIVCIERGAQAMSPIVAGGNQACDPHCRGSGLLRPHELIIVDIFPRITQNGYHGDMTRTYLKGRPSNGQKALVETVLEAEQWALGEHRSGKSGRKIYQDVCDRFAAVGYTTRWEKGNPVGFIHGLGHGLGLEVHEPPRVNSKGSRLRKGQVITVEPGLYYPGLGGCRFEDVLRVTAGEPEMLSKHPYRWQVR